MTKIASSFSTLAIALGILLYACAAQAQTARTWVSGTGSQGGLCTRAAPCVDLQVAYNMTLPGGEIDVLDGGDFGGLQISHSITIANDSAGTGAVTPMAIAFLITAGQGENVVLRGLSMLGGVSSNGASASAVEFISGGSLLIDHCNIQGYHQGPAISFGSGANLWVKDTVLSNNGVSTSGSILISAGPVSGSTTAQFERVRILGATGNGIRVDGTTGAGAIDVELHDVTVDAATGGSAVVAVSQTSGGPTVRITADNVTASHNAGYGFRAVGGTASVTLSHSVSEANSVGLGASSGGVVYSYGDNRFANNSSGNGVTPTAIPLE